MGLNGPRFVQSTHAHTHTHTRTRPRAYACGRTLAARTRRQSIGGGGCPCRLGVVLGDLVDVAAYNAGTGRTRMGGGRTEQMCTLHAVVVLCIVFVTMLLETIEDSFTSTICLYLSPSQLCLIERVSNLNLL